MTDTYFTIAVHGKASPEAKLARAIDTVSYRDDLVRPLVVMVNGAVLAATRAPEGVELRGEAFVPVGDYRFLKVTS